MRVYIFKPMKLILLDSNSIKCLSIGGVLRPSCKTQNLWEDLLNELLVYIYYKESGNFKV